jgi:hypothetical protein
MPYSIIDEFEDLFESAEDTKSVDTDSNSDSEDLSFRVSFDPSEELLNEDL